MKEVTDVVCSCPGKPTLTIGYVRILPGGHPVGVLDEEYADNTVAQWAMENAADEARKQLAKERMG